jgi:hypothetical protein
MRPHFELTNDTAATVTATDCGQSQAPGFSRCRVISRIVLAPGKTGSFARSSAGVNSEPNILAISGPHEKQRCWLVPPSSGPVVLTKDVSDASAAQCSLADFQLPS